MPVGNYMKETYQKLGGICTYKLESFHFKKNIKKVKTLNPKCTFIDKAILDLDSLINLAYFTFSIDSTFQSSFKKWAIENRIGEEFQTDQLFSEKGNYSITVNPLEIYPDSLDEYTVFDGRRFSLIFKYKIADKNTVAFNYSGNIDDGVKSKDINKWLSVYILSKKHKLFSKNKGMSSFFSDNQFYTIIVKTLKRNKST